MTAPKAILVRGAAAHNLKDIDVDIPRGAITVITGVSGSGKSSLAFDTILAEAQRRFFYTLSHYSRQYLDLSARPRVKTIVGLSPTISLQQNETQPSRKATVATLTDAGELIGVLFANYGTQYCPKHDLPTGAMALHEIVSAAVRESEGQTVAICAPLVEAKKGNFAAQMQGLADKGFVRAYVDGMITPLSPTPKLKKDERHTIKLLIDVVKVKGGSSERLARSVETALDEAAGYCELIPLRGPDALDVANRAVFSTKGGCPECGFSWPRLDARYFSSNSLGKCSECGGLGNLAEGDGDDEQTITPCAHCCGTGLSPVYGSIRLKGKRAIEFHTMSISELAAFLTADDWGRLQENPAFLRVRSEIAVILARVSAIGLGYLQLSRRITSMSGGEAQRLRLANILAESLRGVIYVLDEPSQGLHATELEFVWTVLARLKDLGNTVIIVDHDEFFMKRADVIIDLGPGGGDAGGNIIARFSPAEAASHSAVSATARHMIQSTAVLRLASQRDIGKKLVVKDICLNNLRIPRLAFALNSFNVVTGVSGAGKSSLVLGTLFPNLYRSLHARGKGGVWTHCSGIDGAELVTSVELISRKPIAKSSVSMPATYLDVFSDIRKIYEKLPDSQLAGLTAKSYSLFSEGGRCEECAGRGVITLTMRFLADARILCSVCHGHRFQESVRDVKYLGKSISDVLNMTLQEAWEHFGNHKLIRRRIEPAIEIGLGYLKLGQASSSLSGGESQRLKLVPYLAKERSGGSVLIIDEPTCGLHSSDVDKMLKIFDKLVDRGSTLIVIEHHPDVICASDWVVDIGPGASFLGGQLLYQGQPQGLLGKDGSPTGSVLRDLLRGAKRF